MHYRARIWQPTALPNRCMTGQYHGVDLHLFETSDTFEARSDLRDRSDSDCQSIALTLSGMGICKASL